VNRKFWVWLDSFSDNRKTKIENPKWAGLFAIVVALTVCGAQAQAQQAGKIPRIGFQSDSPLTAIATRIEGFRQGLRELGYVEGKNIIIEWRSSEGNAERRSDIVAEWGRLKVDAIVSSGPSVTRPLKDAVTAIPIVMAQDTDPVGNGFVASLARPGGNVTGLSTLAAEMTGKQLEFTKEIIPKLSRVAIIGNSTNPGDAFALREAVLAAGTYQIYINYLDVQEAKDIEPVIRTAAKARADAILVLGNPIFNPRRKEVIELLIKLRLPASFRQPEYVEAGGLLYYGTNYAELFRRAATYVDKILKGAKPADLPVEQPKKFEFIINLKTAKQIGLTIPPNVLARADRVIK
jgi:putative tryptophan/tyrosine transport system substrate-binding protein